MDTPDFEVCRHGRGIRLNLKNGTHGWTAKAAGGELYETFFTDEEARALRDALSRVLSERPEKVAE